jgi:hypothetical protein
LSSEGTLSRQVPEDGEDWDSICRGGPNGFFIIVLALAWWVSAVNGKVERELHDILVDVTWVVGEMVNVVAMQKVCTGEKHTQDDEQDLPARKR